MKNKPSQTDLYNNLVNMLNADIPGVNFKRMMEKHMVKSSNGFKPQRHPFSQPSHKPSNNPIKNNKA